MTTALATQDAIDPAVIAQVILHGDLSKLTPAQKVSYYNAVCRSVGLNPLTKPFQYLTLNGREILYAGRDATDQLRKVHTVSLDITAREVVEDTYVVTARATVGDRHDSSIGAVPMAGLKGEARANAMMKAETKAKRRVTLAICGLGMLDETEVASLEALPTVDPAPAVEAVPAPMGDSEMAILDDPPPGYFYVSGYTFNAPWHEASLPGWASDGSSLFISTKLPATGKLLAMAADRMLPIKPDVTMKQGRKGEAYLNGVQFYDAAQPDEPGR
jgi:hypothetical protein